VHAETGAVVSPVSALPAIGAACVRAFLYALPEPIALAAVGLEVTNSEQAREEQTADSTAVGSLRRARILSRADAIVEAVSSVVPSLYLSRRGPPCTPGAHTVGLSIRRIVRPTYDGLRRCRVGLDLLQERLSA
jgi:hypothetical protein